MCARVIGTYTEIILRGWDRERQLFNLRVSSSARRVRARDNNYNRLLLLNAGRCRTCIVEPGQVVRNRRIKVSVWSVRKAYWEALGERVGNERSRNDIYETASSFFPR